MVRVRRNQVQVSEAAPLSALLLHHFSDAGTVEDALVALKDKAARLFPPDFPVEAGLVHALKRLLEEGSLVHLPENHSR